MQKKLLVSILFISILAFLGACNNETTTPNNVNEEKPMIYTTVYPLKFFTEQIGADLVHVESIYPAGADEHTFEPTQKDMMKLADSDHFFYIGHQLEGFVPNAEKSLKKEDVTFHAIGEMIPENLLLEGHSHHDEEEHDGHEEHGEEAHEEEHDEHHHHHGDIDAHLWITPTLGEQLATNIHAILVEALPEEKETLDQNLEEVKKQLTHLDEQFKEMSNKATKRTFFVSHAAFGYLARDYDLEQVAVAGLNSQSEPSQKQLAQLVELAKEKNIDYIFFEQNVSSKLTEVIQKEIGAEALELHNLGVLTEENIKNEDDYYTLMERNVEALTKALH